MTTKIIATVGPTSENLIPQMRALGVEIFRLNFSHGSRAWHRKQIEKINAEGGIAMMDTRGPEIRSGEFEGELALKKGDRLTLVTNITAQNPNNRLIFCSYADLPKSLNLGDTVLFDNGRFAATTTSVHQNSVVLVLESEGVLRSARHINLPDVRVNLPTISKKDEVDIRFAIEAGAKMVALSFAREAKDILHAREIAGDSVKIIAKIECKEAVKNFSSIARAADGVMIARGDLAVETNLEGLPVLQRDLLKKIKQFPETMSIVATGLLRSMVSEPTPHRAEVTDIANAIWEGSDALMLSDETANGKYPIEAIKEMARIIEKSKE